MAKRSTSSGMAPCWLVALMRADFDAVAIADAGIETVAVVTPQITDRGACARLFATRCIRQPEPATAAIANSFRLFGPVSEDFAGSTDKG